MSTRSVLTVGGAIIGGIYGGPQGAAWGAMIGGWIAGVVDPMRIEGPRLDDTRVTSSTYGTPIPIVYGASTRVGGNAIWSSGLTERKRTQDGVANYFYRTSVAVAISQGTCGGVRRIWANKKLLWDIADVTSTVPTPYSSWSLLNGADYPAGPLGSIAFYPGDFAQMPDPTIEAALGVGNAPAYRGTCYVMLHDLQLADYGNALPNLEFELDGVFAPRYWHVLDDISRRAGLLPNEYNVHWALYTRRPLTGYWVNRASNAAGVVVPMQVPGAFDSSEQHGQVRFMSRGFTPRASIELGRLGARQAWSGPASRLTLSRAPDHDLPSNVTVTYSDAERDYQTNTQAAERIEATGESLINIDVPMTLTADQARQVADRVLWEMWSGRTTARFALMLEYDFLRAGDKIGVEIGGRVVMIRITRLTRGDNAVIECEGIIEDSIALESTAAGEAAFVPAQIAAVAGDTIAYLFNAPLLFATDSATGMYFVLDSEQDAWRGGALMRSADGGLTWINEGTAGVRSTIGAVAAALPSGPTAIWDEVNTVTIVLESSENELASVDELAALAGVNTIWLGDADGSTGEVIYFRDATLTAPQTYELAGLLRGRNGTEHAVGAHGVNEVAVFIERTFNYTVDYGISDWTLSRDYRGVSLFQDVADVTTTVTAANTGERSKPRAPVLAEGSRDGSNNLTMVWIRRTRFQGPWMGYGALPLDEPSEAYEVDVLDGITVVRTISTATPAASYTAAEQTADGLTPGDPVDVLIYQISPTFGRGHAGEFTL